MAMYNFGAGVLWGTPTIDANGAAIINATPLMLAVTQEVSIDIQGDIKELYGSNQFPVAVGRGKMKITGKAKYGQFNGAVMNSLFFGQTMTSSLYGIVNDVTGATIPGTPFSITPTVPGSGSYVQDLGVRDATGNPMTRVATGPTTGQYAVNISTGAYTFAAADTGKVVFISYSYNSTSTVAKTSVVQNIAMGQAPTFRADFFNQLGGNGLALTLFACVSNKLALQTKIDDFMIPELDFSAFADASGNVLKWGSAQ